MISLMVKKSSFSGEIIEDKENLRFSQSYLEPFQSKVIERSYSHLKQSKLFWIGEEHYPFGDLKDAVQKTSQICSCSEFEGIFVNVTGRDGDLNIEIARTSTGTTPMYVAMGADKFVASWRFEEAVAALDRIVPNGNSCQIYLKHYVALQREQIFEGIFMLWPGESLSLKNNIISFFTAPDPMIYLETMINDDASVTEEFLYNICQSIENAVNKSDKILIEVSGGYDSTCVALAAKSFDRNMSSYGIIHDGPMGVQQDNRRNELNRILHFDDFTFKYDRKRPLESLEFIECSITPNDENHRLACALAIDNHPTKGFDLVITGIGGDEITMENTFQRHDWELPGGICPSAIEAAVSRADLFMRRGIWPKNPLMSQSVVNFSRSLPKALRLGRMLNILTITRAGLSDGFLFPRYIEHCGTGMLIEASLYDYDLKMRDSILAEYQVIDFSDLLRKARGPHREGLSFSLIGELYNLVKLETILKHYMS